MAGSPTAGRAASGTHGKQAGRKVSPKAIIGGLILIAAVWFIVVNRESVGIYLWVPKVTAPPRPRSTWRRRRSCSAARTSTTA